MKSYSELIKRLREIKKMGYLKTHRSGKTGIGKTIEDLLGIKENNIPGPDGKMIELKSARKNAKSMLTLFTKAPLPKKANSVLLQKHGYLSSRGNNKKELHSTINAVSFNTLKGRSGLKAEISDNKIKIINSSHEVLGYYDESSLKEAYEKKIPRLLYVKADSRGNGSNEEFWFNEAWLLKGFDFGNFLKLLKDGVILVDIRIGQYPDGRPHDHGTGFRIFPDKLDLVCKVRKRVL